METSTIYPSDQFTYKYLIGPVETPVEIDGTIKEGNCRLALQLYFYRIHKKFLERDEVYLPGGYKTLGHFVFKEEPISFDKLKEGDILYAQNFRNKKGEELHRDLETYKNKDEWLYHLHSAIYVGKIDKDSDEHYIWHATNIEGGTALWALEKFQYYYKPISVKRVTV
ncbi:MAG: hypothetical protein KGH79_04690 [Patescibacteria group bacterium]|nr:hypothetical protein [Patescibacteria group bacterium]